MPDKKDHLNKLFQKAARDYPLKTDNSNWDDVAAKLENAAKSEAVRKKRWRYPVIILLFAVGSMIVYKIQSDNRETQLQQAPAKKVSEQNISTIKSNKVNNNVPTLLEDLKIAETKQGAFKKQELAIVTAGTKIAIGKDDNNSITSAQLLNLNNLVVVNSKKQPFAADNYARAEIPIKPDQQIISDNGMNENVQEVSAQERKSLKIQLKPAYRI